jgi:hypothetical protein
MSSYPSRNGTGKVSHMKTKDLSKAQVEDIRRDLAEYARRIGLDEKTAKKSANIFVEELTKPAKK